MDKIIAFSNKTDGRDILTKSIQYSARTLAYLFTDIDNTIKKQFYDLFRN